MWPSCSFYLPGRRTPSIEFDYSTLWKGSTPPGTPPWLKATFANNGTNHVTLTLDAFNVDGGHVLLWAFNLDPTLNANSLSVMQTSGPKEDQIANNVSLPANAGIKGNDTQVADTNGLFDLKFTWSIHPFTAGMTAVFDISMAGLTENSFSFLSSPRTDIKLGPVLPGGAESLAQITYTTPVSAQDYISGDPIPEPATIIIWSLLGGLGLVFAWRKRKSA